MKIASFGRPLAAGKRKRGRPPGAKTSWRAVPGLRKKRAEVSAASKLSLVQELKKMETATGSSSQAAPAAALQSQP